MEKKNTIAVGIGSNVGDRLFHLQQAISRLDQLFKNLKVSSIIETEALLLPNAPPEWDLPFLNCVVTGESDLAPLTLLKTLQQMEGSKKRGVWGPRELDLDILAIDDCIVDEKDLKIPHPELLKRPFAFYPMAQLLPYWKHPGDKHGKTLIEHTQGCHDFKRSLIHSPQLVGIVNITPDSFSDGNHFLQVDKAIAQAEKLWNEGASWIDLGAASTNPKSTYLSAEKEWQRLKPVLVELKKLEFCPRLSVDTYHTENALKALHEFDIGMVNYLGPQVEKELCLAIEERKKQIVIMHHLTVPANRSVMLPFDVNPMKHVLEWASLQINDAESKGLSRDRLILDPGIGFGKNALQNMLIIKQIRQLKKFGLPVFVGHSRKSFLQVLSRKEPVERDEDSAALSVFLMQEGVDYLRVHDVKTHMERLAVHYVFTA